MIKKHLFTTLLLVFSVIASACTPTEVEKIVEVIEEVEVTREVEVEVEVEVPVEVEVEVTVEVQVEPAVEITLHVFGPNELSQLAADAPEDVRAAAQQQVFDGFLSENPEVVSIEWDAQGAIQDEITRLITARLAGEQMDLISCAANPTNGTYVRQGLLYDITDEIAAFRDRFDEAALEGYTSGGRVYGVPNGAITTSSFFYNVDLFNELGISEPATYEEFVDISQQLSDAGYIPVLHQGKTTFFWPMWYFETAGQTMENAVEKTRSNLRGDTQFTDPEDVAAMEWLAKFVEDGVLDPGLAVDWDGMRFALASQQSAIYYGGSWELPWLQENVTDFEYGVFPFPQLPGTPSGPGHGGGPDKGICISNGISEERLPYAVKFIEYITRPEVATIYLEHDVPLAAAIKGVPSIETAIGDDMRANHFPDNVLFLDHIWPRELNNAFIAAIQGVVGGTISADEGMASVQAVYDELVVGGYTYD